MTAEEFAKNLIGQKIVDCSLTSITLDDGTEVRWSIGGDIGADSEWYQFLGVYLNGKEMARL